MTTRLPVFANFETSSDLPVMELPAGTKKWRPVRRARWERTIELTEVELAVLQFMATNLKYGAIAEVTGYSAGRIRNVAIQIFNKLGPITGFRPSSSLSTKGYSRCPNKINYVSLTRAASRCAGQVPGRLGTQSQELVSPPPEAPAL
jgi:hypothetical protein